MTTFTKSRPLTRRDAVAAAFVAAVLFTVGFYWFPLIGDDLNYRMPFRHTLPSGYIRPGDAIDFLIELYHRDNIRLANITMVALMPLPKWVGMVGSFVALFYTMIAGMRMAGIARAPFLCASWIVFVVLALPWADQMYVFDFQLNYLWAGALSLFVLRKAMKGGLSPWYALVLGFVTGAWHEGFSIPLFCAIALLMLMNKRYHNSSNIYIY